MCVQLPFSLAERRLFIYYQSTFLYRNDSLQRGLLSGFCHSKIVSPFVQGWSSMSHSSFTSFGGGSRLHGFCLSSGRRRGTNGWLRLGRMFVRDGLVSCSFSGLRIVSK